MKVLAKPKFYVNPDESHCVQACLKSIFSVALPGEDFTWEQLEELTDYLPGHGAWEYAELVSLSGLGLQVQSYTGLNPKRFIKDDFKYLEEEFGKEYADYERKHPHDFDKLKRKMQICLDKNLVTNRRATVQDIRKSIDDGRYVMLLINNEALNGKAGYAGHRVLVYGYDDNGLIVHNSGPSHAGEGKHISWKLLDKAWPDAKEMITVKG